MYPTKLDKIINLFESLPEDERRETLVSYADNAKRQEPREGENFDLVDVRKDEECTDTVGVYLHLDEQGKAHIRMTLGPEVQTLTRAMTAILCKGLDGSTPKEILDLPSDFVTRVVGAELVRVRSQTVYYVLTRIKSICKVWLDRQRMAAVAQHTFGIVNLSGGPDTRLLSRFSRDAKPISFTIPAGADAAK
jgi:cysteine desulfuration protein SufE